MHENNVSQVKQLSEFIWRIASDVLANVYTRGEYRNVILPMIVLRRLDTLLPPDAEAMRQCVTTARAALAKRGNKQPTVAEVADYIYNYQRPKDAAGNTLDIFNATAETLADVNDTDPQALLEHFRRYIDGFPATVREVLDKFQLRRELDTLSAHNALRLLLNRFLNSDCNLSPLPSTDARGNELPGVDNHTMGTIYEELLRRFNDETNITAAGEHFTPRDVVALMADLAFRPVMALLTNEMTYTLYDGACGTGGILFVSHDRATELAAQAGKTIYVRLYGEELQDQTWATCQAELLMRGIGDAQVVNGSTLSHDGLRSAKDGGPRKFDFCISNPPFGLPWSRDLEQTDKEGKLDKTSINDGRFSAVGAEGEALSFLPQVGDGQMLFLANNVARLRPLTEKNQTGSRVVEVHNGSSLFNGEAGSGESNLRRYIIENDWLEAIVALPEKMFYNTGLGTYLWVLSNHKPAVRRGQVQLIDATQQSTALRKSLGNKSNELSAADREAIVQTLLCSADGPRSKMLPNREFGYWQVTVERPLRLRVLDDWPERLQAAAPEASDNKRQAARRQAWDDLVAKLRVAQLPPDDWSQWAAQAANEAERKLLDKMRPSMTRKDPAAKPVEGSSDPDLADSEQVPLLYPGGIDGYMRAEVLPYTPDAFCHQERAVVGYQIPFSKYFFHASALRSADELRAELRTLTNEAQLLLKELGL